MRAELNKYVVVDSKICHGQPTFIGTRIMVSIVLEMLEDGASIEEIIKAYPSLDRAHIKAASEFADLEFLKQFKSQSELTKEDALRLGSKVNEALSKRCVKLSKEEQDFIKWSVELRRKAKRESFEKILSQLSPEERKELGLK